ncbi:GNAT family N-acetyltransferase [Acutalibacter caecimuris]|uniref:GNAT family N-acetyltransferase n=1 Tax=Acutalibacter caecimuris TaxID=3093657 RepID=UPI002AC9C637|nr:GNAT family N-acetyltransferase [Acutalibacter sp. M00118]
MPSLQLRKATPADIPAMAGLYEQARQALAAAGVNQWQDGYPNAASAGADVQSGTAYVLVEGGRVVACACLAFGQEPTYAVIEQGNWLGQGPYGYLHRVAVSGAAKGRGAAGRFFAELERQARAQGLGAIRGDTHRDNRPMQRVMAKAGLTLRGVIYVEDGTPRLAYEKLLDG